MAKRFSLSFTLFLFFSDLLLVIISLMLATWLRIVVPLGKAIPPEEVPLPWPVYLLAAAVWGLTFVALNVYNPARATRLVSELQVTGTATMFAFLQLTGALYLTYRGISRLQILYFAVFYIVLVSLHRLTLRGLFAAIGGRSYDGRGVVIVGTSEIARDVAQMIAKHAWTGLRLLGFIGDSHNGQLRDYAPVLGPIDEALSIVEASGAREVIIALPSRTEQELREFIAALQTLPINVRVVPDYFDLAFLQVRVEDFGGMPLLTLKEPTLDPFQRLTKRAFDLVLTALLLIPALLTMAIIAIIIRLDSAGPIIFKQERVGEGGNVFGMYKFRSMTPEADSGPLGILHEEGQAVHKHPDDPRVTRVGHVLRRYSLDEIPQLFNVLKGEMSLVGPRPEMPWLVDKYQPWQRKRFDVPQGITGWWQVNGRSDKPMHLHTEEDLFYIRNYSLWLDLRILWRTFGAVLRGEGAY